MIKRIKGHAWDLYARSVSLLLNATGIASRFDKSPIRRIVIYHHLDNRAVSSFERQIAYYHDNYRVLSLSDYVATLDNAEKNDDNIICITFDDGYKSIYKNAAPTLDKYKIKPCIFVPVGFIETPDKLKYIKDNFKANIFGDSISWDELKELIDRGYEIGCHSWSHVDFGVLDIDYEHELKHAKDELQRISGLEIKYFAFPFGMTRNISRKAIDKTKEYGYNKCFSGMRMQSVKGDFLLPRTYINPFWSRGVVRCVLAGYFDKN